MDRREAFIKFLSPEWSPAFPDNDTFEVGGKYRTIREVCELVKDDDGVLPDDPIVRDLMWVMHGYQRLLEKLGRSRTYATGSQCRLLEMLDDRIRTFQTKR